MSQHTPMLGLRLPFFPFKQGQPIFDVALSPKPSGGRVRKFESQWLVALPAGTKCTRTLTMENGALKWAHEFHSLFLDRVQENNSQSAPTKRIHFQQTLCELAVVSQLGKCCLCMLNSLTRRAAAQSPSAPEQSIYS